MATRYSKFFRAIHVVGDFFLLNFSIFICNSFYYNDLTTSFSDHFIKQFLYFNLFWVLSTSILRVYGMNRVVKVESVFSTLLRAFLLHLLFVLAFVLLFKEYLYSYKLFVYKYMMFVILTTSWRIGFLSILKILRRRGLNFRSVIILGRGPTAQDAFRFFTQNPEHGYRFLGFFDPNYHPIQHPPGRSDIIGSIEDVKKFAIDNQVDEIYCSMPEIDKEVIQDLMDFSDDNLIRFKLLPDFRGLIRRKMEISFYNEIPVLMFRKEPLDSILNRFVKRTFDILFSLSVIILIFPWLLPIIAIIIKLSSRGPIFFKQLRTGIRNESFYCFKFRSMRINDVSHLQQAQKDDPRITKVGKFLRKSSLDEVPQFFNVLIGDMSIVGPRPHMLMHTERYSKIVDKFMVRHFVKPGITGMAQVRGFRGETKDPALMEKRVQYDIWYIENWSLVLDIKLIFLTVWGMVAGDKNAF